MVNELVHKTITNEQNQTVIAESFKQVLSSKETKAGIVNLFGKSSQK
jgi:succinyl-CoA synthetase beta subunit